VKVNLMSARRSEKTFLTGRIKGTMTPVEMALNANGEMEVSVDIGDLVNTNKPEFSDTTPLAANKAKFSGWIDAQEGGAIGAYAWVTASVKTDVAGNLYIVQSDDISLNNVEFQDLLALVATNVVIDPTANPPITAARFIGAFRVAVLKRYVGAILVNGAAPQTLLQFNARLLAI
jgi:hypothetical protein